MITAIPDHEIVQIVTHQLSALWPITKEECDLINVKWGG